MLGKFDGMSGISLSAVFSTSQIKAEFSNDIGSKRVILGTGFWFEAKNRRYFVTNAHNVDPRMKLGLDTPFKLSKIWILMRKLVENGPSEETVFAEVANLHEIIQHQTSDVALVPDPKFTENTERFQTSSFRLEDTADISFFENRLNTMDAASFIGFPGNGRGVWYDQKWNLPIARTVNIASYPNFAFSNSGISTTDVLLVSGLSFSGSSGSPIISHSKDTYPGYLGAKSTPPKLIGIMSGHWKENGLGDVFDHSGLSYLTRSTSILELLPSL